MNTEMRKPLFGRLCIKMGRFADAVTSLSRTIRLDPSNTLAHCELAIAAFQLGEHTLAWREARVAGQFIQGEDPLVPKLDALSQEVVSAQQQ